MKERLRRIRNLLLWLALASWKPRKPVLLYLGVNAGESFDRLFRDYRRCIGFEADPDLARKLQRRYRRHRHVTIVNAAAADRDGETEFHIADNGGRSSSLGRINPACPDTEGVAMTRTVRVKTVNLHDYCAAHKIDSITDYVSDIQGMDLAVLTTMRPFIDRGAIGSITCEVSRDDRPEGYLDAPRNNMAGFSALLSARYLLTASGWGTLLTDGSFHEFPPACWYMDCRWRLRAP